MDTLKLYASTIYKNDIRYLNPSFNKLEQPDVPELEQKFTKTKSTDNQGVVSYKKSLTAFESAVYNKQIKTWIKAAYTIDSTLRYLYNIVWGQCSKLMQKKLKASRKFEDRDIEGDVPWLLVEIRSISHQLEANLSLYDSVDESKRAYYLYVQEPEDTNATHFKNYRTKMDVVKHFGSNLFHNEALIAYEKEKDKEDGKRD